MKKASFLGLAGSLMSVFTTLLFFKFVSSVMSGVSSMGYVLNVLIGIIALNVISFVIFIFKKDTNFTTIFLNVVSIIALCWLSEIVFSAALASSPDKNMLANVLAVVVLVFISGNLIASLSVIERKQLVSVKN